MWDEHRAVAGPPGDQSHAYCALAGDTNFMPVIAVCGSPEAVADITGSSRRISN